MSLEQSQVSTEGVAPAASPFPPFPPTTVDDGIATISFRVPGNGHVHYFKVPEDALSFLQDLWSRTPFKVSSGGKAKKLILPDGTPVHVLWLKSKGYDLAYRKPKCENHDKCPRQLRLPGQGSYLGGGAYA
jgi:hypothetical protein